MNPLLSLLLRPRLDREVALLCDVALAATIAVFPSILGVVCGAAYLLLRDVLPILQRRSFGKNIFDLVVVRTADMLPAPWQLCFLRNVLLAVPPLTIIDTLRFVLKGRRLTDEWLGTDVVRDPQAALHP